MLPAALSDLTVGCFPSVDCTCQGVNPAGGGGEIPTVCSRESLPSGEALDCSQLGSLAAFSGFSFTYL